MKILILGGGGREHAIISKLAKSRHKPQLFCAPGNGGIASIATCVPIKATDVTTIRDWAVENAMDFVVVTPDDPLALGAVDMIEAADIPCFGPNQAAAKLEWSKAYSKDFMLRHGIPTAAYANFTELASALEHVQSAALPLVVKADGLAAGKGVVIAHTHDEAVSAVRAAMEGGAFGDSGRHVVIEEFLTGPEVTLLTFCDGKTIVPMLSSMDHKRIGEGDVGLNTGGMGVIAPSPYYTAEIAAEVQTNIIDRTLVGMQAEGIDFRGCLYFGLMLTPDGVRVIEYNARFGDPETQALMPLLESDLLDIFFACSEGRLAETEVKFAEGHSCCVIMASSGYPEKYPTGFEISIPNDVNAEVIHAGTTLREGKYYTAGGRVLAVTAVGESAEAAYAAAYAAVERIGFEGAYYRRDIGKMAMGKSNS